MRRSVAILDANGKALANEPDILPVYSIAKTFLASAIRAANINPERLVADWISSQWLPDSEGITVKHLLQHTAGLSDYSVLPEYHQAIERGDPPWSDEEYARRTLHQPRQTPPGTGFAYSNPGYWLLKKILEIEYSQPWDVVLQQLILAPLGLNDTRVKSGLFSVKLPRYPAQWVWHGLIMSSALDIARFIHSDLVRGLEQDAVRVAVNQPPWVNPHYGYGVMIEPDIMYGHNGGGPGYTASGFHFQHNGRTGVVLLESDEPEGAMKMLLELMAQSD
ncbi:MAG: serine hydrolase domain-containing protein [bacterium]